MSEKEQSDLVCGIERQLVESFLTILRDNYKAADKATFFLEQRTGIINIQGIANLRDVLSHLATFLNFGPDTPIEKKVEQIGNAEEHLRRATIEPYETAINDLFEKFNELYFRYKRDLLPVKDRHIILQNALNAVSVDAHLKEFGELYERGRAGKGKNIWSTEWEEGVKNFIAAYDKLSSIYTILEGHWNNYEQIIRDKKATRLGGWGIAAEAIAFILGIVVTLLLMKC